ncbi:MAG: TldD/PmbA family protein [Nitrospiraceae bacterium]|nr:TldD/PmbA family protein [Nitrospiraceae bacterium]
MASETEAKTEERLARLIIDMAVSGGADSAEVYMRAKRGVSAESRSAEPESVKTSLDWGYALRVIKDRRAGFSYSTSREDFGRTVQAALDAAKYTGEDPFLRLPFPGARGAGLPGGGTSAAAEIFDPRVAGMTAQEAFALAREIESAALGADPKRIKRARSATASFNSAEVLIVNSNGFSGSYRSTSATAQIMAVAEDGGESQMGWDFMGGAFLSDVSFGGTGRGAAEKALKLLGSKRTVRMKAPVVLAGAVAAEFLDVFASMLSAESVQKGKSLLRDRLGEEVVSKKISVVDDGLLPHGMGSAPFDDEGVPASKKTLIMAGALTGYMHNTYTAARQEAESQAGPVLSTGNAVRPGLSSFPVVGPLNFYLAPAPGVGPLELEGLFARAGRGLYIIEAMGMHTINAVTGEFSIGVAGLLIEGGGPSHPVKEAVISGNLLEFFGNVEAVGDDMRFYGSTGSPSILIGPTDISA